MSAFPRFAAHLALNSLIFLMAARSLGIGGCQTDVVRPLRDVLNRTLTLGAAVAVACGAPSDELLSWLAEVELLGELSPKERMLLTEKTSPGVPELDPEVVQERHHAINWLVGYSGQQWDEVTTDT